MLFVAAISRTQRLVVIHRPSFDWSKCNTYNMSGFLAELCSWTSVKKVRGVNKSFYTPPDNLLGVVQMYAITHPPHRCVITFKPGGV